MVKLSDLKVKCEDNFKLLVLLNYSQELDDWDFDFIMEIYDRNWISESQQSIIDKIYYKVTGED